MLGNILGEEVQKCAKYRIPRVVSALQHYGTVVLDQITDTVTLTQAEGTTYGIGYGRLVTVCQGRFKFESRGHGNSCFRY